MANKDWTLKFLYYWRSQILNCIWPHQQKDKGWFKTQKVHKISVSQSVCVCVQNTTLQLPVVPSINHLHTTLTLLTLLPPAYFPILPSTYLAILFTWMLVVINFIFDKQFGLVDISHRGDGGKENSQQDVGNVRVLTPTIDGDHRYTILANDSVIKQTHFSVPLKSMGLLSVGSEQVKDMAYLFPLYQKCSRFLLNFCNLHRTHPGYPPHSRKCPFQFSPDGLHGTLKRHVWYFLQVGNRRQTANSITSHMITVSYVRSWTAPT